MRPLSYLSILSVSCLLAACIARDQRAGLPATPAQTETRVRSSADSKKAEPAAAVDQSFAGELRKDAALATKNTALRGNIVHAQDAIASSYAIAPGPQERCCLQPVPQPNTERYEHFSEHSVHCAAECACAARTKCSQRRTRSWVRIPTAGGWAACSECNSAHLPRAG